MGYPSFEGHVGDLMTQVSGNSRYLTSQGVFDENSMVPVANVEAYATNAYYWVVGCLLTNGYGTAVANAAVSSILTNIQALHTSVQVESAIPVTERGEVNTRYRGFASERDKLVDLFISRHALDELGQSRSDGGARSDRLELTGRSVSRKASVYSQEDVVPARFKRGYQNTDSGFVGGSGGGGGGE